MKGLFLSLQELTKHMITVGWGLTLHEAASEMHPKQACAKTRVFHQKPSPVGLTGLNRVLMGFMS